MFTTHQHGDKLMWRHTNMTRRQHNDTTMHQRNTPTQRCGAANRCPLPAPSLPHTPPPLPPTIRRHDIAATARRIDHVTTT
ncbi:hypothetical protein CTheo_9143 [Ceratobasidium theobromae]|uniref:Uncharacterized protein n=1 Tax=Ceratobasidium theobromae TaxID=1582974 RepID=A0A5N5Q6J1_9AGAM|nr:hypothetical protein CTheo_9143 [Ceratobasidium theobromae]